jgi:hypothetical protein
MMPTYRVFVHRIDRCNTPAGPNSCFALCPACTAATAYRVLETLSMLYENLGFGDVAKCKRCQHRILHLHDVFTVENLRDVA